MLADTVRNRCAALLIAVTGVALSAFAWSGSARAHASLIAVEPAEGAIVAEKPAAFRLTFNEPVSPLVLKLVAPDGSVNELSRPSLDGPTLAVPAPTDMPAGTYVLSWRVVSLDGHPVGGTVAFSLGHPSAWPLSPGAATQDWPLRIAIWLAEIIFYAGLFLGPGAALSRALIAPLPQAARTLGILTAFAGLVAAGVSVGLQGLDAVDAPLGTFLHPAIWQEGFSTTYGTTAAVAALALIVAVAALLARSERAAALLAFIAAAGTGLALAASGHASTAPPQWLTRPAVFVHAVALVFWIGALPPLALTLRLGGERAAEALARFSRLIPVAVVPLVLSGLALAAIQLGSPAALAGTAYGRVLLAKLILLAGLFGLAAWNRWALTEKAESGDPAAALTLARSIVAETLLVMAILAVVALWRFTPPPRALAEAAPRAAQVHLHGDKAMALLSVSPGRVGPVNASIAIMPEGSKPVQPSEVTLVILKPDSGLEAIARSAHANPEGVWQVDDLVVPLAGAWVARVVIRVGDFEEIRLEGPLEIAP